MSDFFSRLDEYLKSNKVRLREFFDSHDLDDSGELDSKEVVAMLREVMPKASQADLKYLRQQLDADNSGGIT